MTDDEHWHIKGVEGEPWCDACLREGERIEREAAKEIARWVVNDVKLYQRFLKHRDEVGRT